MRFGDSSTNSPTFQTDFSPTARSNLDCDLGNKNAHGVDVPASLKPAYYRANGIDRRGHARLRIHGEGTLERLPQGAVPGLAAPARATARRDRRAEPGCGRGGGAPVWLRAVDDRLARHRH